MQTGMSIEDTLHQKHPTKTVTPTVSFPFRVLTSGCSVHVLHDHCGWLHPHALRLERSTESTGPDRYPNEKKTGTIKQETAMVVQTISTLLEKYGQVVSRVVKQECEFRNFLELLEGQILKQTAIDTSLATKEPLQKTIP